MRSGRIESIDVIRGYAALAVCAFHLSHTGMIFPPGLLRDALAHGGVGVPIFFVVSGFVIPYSLWSTGYTLRSFGRFMLRRLVRLEPPYLVAVLVAIGLWLRFGFHAGEPLRLDSTNVLLHAGYLVDISRWAGVDVHWFAPVFWTLAYEFQFYIAAALAFPLLSSKRRDVRLASFAAFLGLQVIGSGPFLYQFADMFLLGIVIFQRRAGLSGMREFAGLAVAATACIAWRYPSFIVYAPLLCALMLRIEIRSAVTRFAGDISYSVYLYHETFGLWLVGALVTVAKLPAAGAFLLGIVGAIAFAAVMHMLVERPALNASRALRNWRPFATPSRPTASSESPLR